MKLLDQNSRARPGPSSWLWHRPAPQPRFSPVLERLCWVALGFAVAGILAAALTT